MPKLIIKQDLPEPSLQDKLEGWLRTFLPLLFLLMIAATAVALYFSQRPLAVTQVAEPALSGSAWVQPAVEPAAKETVIAPPAQAAAKTTATAEPPAGLPADFCPLFGPGAAECKAGAGKAGKQQ